jgi:hypothetical protein
MEQLSFFGRIDKPQHGKIWWHGNYQCRNFHGYFQDRENGIGKWKFVIHAFGETECEVYSLDALGDLTTSMVPMTQNAQLLIDGNFYCNSNWRH